MTAILDSLTDEQLAAVTASGQSVHVSAPPGAGKTSTLAGRAAWLIAELGIDPTDICCLTFTRAAAHEIRSRVEVSASLGCAISTFHERAIIDGPSLGLMTIASEEEDQAARRSIREGPMRRPARDVVGVEDLDRAIRLHEATSGWVTDHKSVNCVRLVLDRLSDAGLLPAWHLVPRLRAAQGTARVRTYAHVLVDEGQDASQAEIEAAMAFAGERGNVFIVSSLAQAIMGFRFAEPSALPPVTHRLTRTFRFGDEIAAHANMLEVGDRITECAPIESRVVTGSIEEVPDLVEADGSTAVLVRTHSDADAVASMAPELLRHIRRDPLDGLASDADRIQAAIDDGKVPVVTVHGAKGREFDRVLVIGPSTYAWGRASSDPEEMRVLYVAMTRARRELVLVTGEPDPATGWRARHCGISGGAS